MSPGPPSGGLVFAPGFIIIAAVQIIVPRMPDAHDTVAAGSLIVSGPGAGAAPTF